MDLKTWLTKHEYTQDDIMFLSIGTDGLSAKKNEIMSFSVISPTKVGTVYVDGAEPELTQEYTGVSSMHYNERKVPFLTGVNQVKEALDGISFIVTYNKKFQTRWLHKYDLMTVFDVPIFDVTNWFRVRLGGQTLEVDYDTIEMLIAAVDSAAVGSKCGFNELVSTYLRDMPKDKPDLEMKPSQLQHLWNIALTC